MTLPVCQITSVHSRYDTRIFYKECISLARNGYDVNLLVADGQEDEVRNGVSITSVRPSRSVLDRIFIGNIRIYKRAIRLKSKIYHFHDPELIIAGLLLRLSGKKVIYDIHEDYVTSIYQRAYIKRYLAGILGFFYNWLERGIASFFYQIIAEKYYEYRFPKAIKILNYPIIDTRFRKKEIQRIPYGQTAMLYTGNINMERGAKKHLQILNRMEGATLTMIGYTPEPVYERLKDEIDQAGNKLTLIGKGEYINFSRILDAYLSYNYSLGLVIFSNIKHYYKTEPTKLFEYMLAGLPVVCSNFPNWKELVDQNDCGICIDPEDFEGIINAILYLKENPEIAKKKGKNGREAVLNKYNWEQEEKKLMDLYKEIAK